MRRLIPQSDYVKSVLLLISGTSVAQVIPIAVSPILTRIYSPDEFGSFAVYMALAMILGVMVTGRYEHAIHLPKKETDALHIAALSCFMSVVISILLLIIVFTFSQPIAKQLGDSAFEPWLYWLPLYTLLYGFHQNFNYWNNRKAKYKRLAINRTMQSGSLALTQIGFGHAGGGLLGLLGGQIAGQMIATSVLAYQTWREERTLIRALNFLLLIELAKKYINFPKYLIIAACLNTAASQLPILLLSIYYNVTVVGLFSLALRVTSTPISVVANAIGDVFRQQASQSYINHGNCKKIYLDTMKRLILLSLGPFTVFFFAAPELFAWFFGEKWRLAGEYAQILTPMLLFQFIVSPLSSMFAIAQKQKLDLLWQILLFSMVALALFLSKYLSSEINALCILSFAYCIAYLVSAAITYHLARSNT
jgi:O-antigen/teichoic acid export membrane protein